MTGSTPNHAFPYPEGGDKVATHTDIRTLANALDARAQQVDTAIEDAVENSENYTDQALGDIPERVAPIQHGTDDGLRVTDRDGRVAFGVTADGSTHIGDTEHHTDQPGYRITDQDGRIALEVDENGSTHIYDLETGDDGRTEVTTLHVFVAAGQSNMSGRGLPVEGPQSPRVMQFGANRRVLEQAPVVLDMNDAARGTSPALFFAHNYLAAQPAHVGVLIIPAARGATGFTWTETADRYTWTNGTALDPEHALYERSVEQTLDGIAAAEAEGYHVIVKGVLWHQGEANGGVATATYETYLDRLIADYRAHLDHPTLETGIGIRHVDTGRTRPGCTVQSRLCPARSGRRIDARRPRPCRPVDGRLGA